MIAEALRRGFSYDKIHEITKIDKWFIDKLCILTEMETALKTQPLTAELLKEAKRIEFPDNVIARLTGKTEEEIKDMRYANGITAAYKMVDTCAAEFAAETPYYYSVFGSENEAIETNDRKKVLVLGSGPIRIGQGIEFDFCSVHCTWAFAKEGYETIIINNNPETVSTDFDIADKLYFEPLTPEDVESIVNLEKPDGAVVQFGGQTAIKLTEALMKWACRSSEHPQRTSMQPKTVNCSMRSWRNAASQDRQATPYLPQKKQKKQQTNSATRYSSAHPMYLADRACRSRSTTKM